MPRRTLIDFYADLSSTSGEFVVYDDGYRSWAYSYADVANAARTFASRLRAMGMSARRDRPCPDRLPRVGGFSRARVGHREGARRPDRRRGRSRRDRNG